MTVERAPASRFRRVSGRDALSSRWVIVARAAIGGFVVLLAALESQWVDRQGSLWPATVVGSYLIASTLAVHLQGLARRRDSFLRAALLGDALAAAVIVHASGSIHSPTLLLLALPVLAAGLLFFAPFGLLAGMLTTLLYGWMALASGSAGATSVELWIRIGFHGFFFACMGVAAGWLARRTAVSVREAAETRHALEEMRLSTDRIVESMGCGLIVADPSGLVRSLNPEARKLLGLLPEAAGLSAARVRSNLPLFTHLKEAVGARATSWDGECRLTREDATTFPAWLKITPIVDDRGVSRGAVALFWDMTERKALERQAGERKRMAMIGEMAAGLAHEMRNSLKPISGSVELLERMDGFPEQARSVCELILRESDSLEAFLSQFLTLSRDKTLKLEWIDLEDFIRQEAGALEAGKAWNPDGLRVSGCVGAGLYGDREWLRQIFRNLLLNAFEAAPHGTVRVLIESRNGAGREWIRVRVCDQGPGLRGLTEEEAFRPFCTTKPAGSGLGLAIAQRGVLEHEGRIGFVAAPDPGGCVFVELPVDGPAARGELRAAA